MALVYDPTAPSHNRPAELGKLLGDLNSRT
jgi:hypothetical protein